MSFLNRNRNTTQTQQSETNVQETTGFENVGTALQIRDTEGDIDINNQVTDLGAIQSAFNFANSVSTQANQTSNRAVDTLSGAITKVSDTSRSDVTDTVRRLGLPLIIAIAAVLGLRAIYAARSK